MKPVVILIVLILSAALCACGDGERPGASGAAAAEAREHTDGESHGAKESHDEHKEASETEGEQLVKLTDEQIKRAGIGLAQAGPANVREHLPLYGVIAPNAERVRVVAARFPGIIRSVNKSIGEAVKQGETLATVESNESLQSYSVTAPLNGVITARNANPGEQTGEEPLFTVADLSTVWVELSLFPRDVSKVHVGQSVRVKSADSGAVGEGKVVYVSPFGSSSNQTLTARVLVENADRKWPPGLYVSAEVVLANTTAPLAVSSSALQTVENESVVFVRGKEGFEPRTVTLGRSDGDVTEVTTGLQPGELYATANSFILKAELGKGSAEHDH